MKIISLEGLNFKNVNEVVELTGKDLYTGPCGSGKSTIQQMLEFVTTGEISEFKSNTKDNLFKMSSDPNKKEIAVTLVTDTNFRFTRKVKRSVKPSPTGGFVVKYAMSYECSPSKEEKKAADFEQRLKEELGINVLMFSLSAFNDMSASEKKRYLMKLSEFDYTKWNLQTIINTLKEDLLQSDLKDNDDKMYNDFALCIDEIIEKYADEISFEENCHSLISVANNKVSEWKDEEKTSRAATEKLTEIKNQVMETSKGITELEGKLDKEQELLITTERTEQQNNSNIEFNINLKSTIDRITGEIETGKALVNPDDVEALKTQINNIDLTEPVKPDLNQLNYKMNINLTEIKKLNKSIDDSQNSIDQENTLRNELNQEVNFMIAKSTNFYDVKISDEQKKINNTNANIEKLSTGLCPLMEGLKCHTDFGPTIAALKIQITSHGNEIKTITSQKEIHVSNLEVKQTQLSEIDEKINHIKTQKTNATVKLNELQEETETYRLESNSFTEAYTTDLQNLNVLKSKVSKLTDNLNTAMSFDQRKQTYLEGKENELKAAELNEYKAVQASDDLTVMISSTRTVINDLKVKINEKKTAKINLENQKSSMTDLKKAENMHMAYRKIKKLLGVEGILGEVLKQGLTPIQEDITSNLRLLGKDVEFYFDTSGTGKKATFDYGWVDRNRVSFTTLSRGESLILTTAILVAFGNKLSGVNCNVLTVDNINDLDRDLLHMYIEGVSKLPHDNIILSGIVNDRIGDPLVGDGHAWNIPVEFKGFKVNVLK